MIGSHPAPYSHSAIFVDMGPIFWLRTLCPCTGWRKLVPRQFGRVAPSPPTHLPPHWAGWKIVQILDFSTFPKTSSRCPIWLFKVTFGFLISSPSLLEHFQALSRSNKRTMRGGGNGTCHAWFQDQSTFEETNFFWRRPPWVAWVGKLKSQSQIAPWSLPSFRNPKN